MTESFGMMDSGYFVSKTEILNWINNTLSLSIDKIESLGSGAIYCQLFDAFFPKSVQISKVNFNAKHQHEFVNNFKILQKAFTSLDIKKYIEVEKLIRMKYQDNLEFIQWVKRFIESAGGNVSEGYDPVKRRGLKANIPKTTIPAKQKLDKKPIKTETNIPDKPKKVEQIKNDDTNKVDNSNKDLEEKIIKLKTDNSNLNADNKNKDNQINELKEIINNLENEVENLQLYFNQITEVLESENNKKIQIKKIKDILGLTNNDDSSEDNKENDNNINKNNKEDNDNIDEELKLIENNGLIF